MFSKRMALVCALIFALSSIASVRLLPAAAVAATGSKPVRKSAEASGINRDNGQLQKPGGAKAMAPPKDGQVNSRLVTANTMFGFRLYGELTKPGADKNIFISPASIAMALA